MTYLEERQHEISIGVCADKLAILQIQVDECEYPEGIDWTHLPINKLTIYLDRVLNGTIEENAKELKEKYADKPKHFYFLHKESCKRAKYLLLDKVSRYTTALNKSYGGVKERQLYELALKNETSAFYENRDFLNTLISGKWYTNDLSEMPILSTYLYAPTVVEISDINIETQIYNWQKDNKVTPNLQAFLTGLLGICRAERIKFNNYPYPYNYHERRSGY